eukprot:Skav209850  [mRNA]  locus=scaffold1684:51014:51871:+ [translate_table: standard]
MTITTNRVTNQLLVLRFDSVKCHDNALQHFGFSEQLVSRGGLLTSSASGSVRTGLDNGGVNMAKPEPWRRTGRKAKEEHFLGLGAHVVLEVSLYDDKWMLQGRGIVQLDERAAEDTHGEGQTWKGRFLAIEDDYYEWWVGNTYPYTSLPFHFCSKQAHNCKEQTYYREPIHVDVFRLLPEDSYLSLGWLTDLKKTEAQRRCYVPVVPGEIAPGPSGGDAAGGHGAGIPREVEERRAGLDGLAAALGSGHVPAEDGGREDPERRRREKRGRNPLPTSWRWRQRTPH